MAKRRKQARQQETAVDPFIWAREYLSTEEQTLLKQSLETEIPPSIRVNCLKSKPADLVTQLSERYGWDAAAIPFTDSGFWIEAGATPVSSTIEHRLGYYYIQEAASMLPAELFDFSEAERPLILDMAASPGGKTIHLIDRTMDKGLVIANDASRSRIPALRVVLENWGAINQAVTCQQGEWFGYALPETFDAVLLDAPCSMQGLRTSASHKSRAITESEIAALADRQVNLLASALRCVRTGGTVVYSTCTLSPQENEGVLAQILNQFPQAVEIVEIGEQLASPAPGIARIGTTQLPDALTHAARLWPHLFNTAGFFCAKLEKNKPLEPAADVTPDQHDHPITPMSADDAASIVNMISDQYGFDLQRVMAEQGLLVTESGGKFFLASQRLLAFQEALPIVLWGMDLGKPLPEGWQPSHALVSRFGDQFTRGVTILDDAYFARWNRGEDIRGVSDAAIQTGSVVAVRDRGGRNLGRGKILNDRIKNQLPTRLF